MSNLFVTDSQQRKSLSVARSMGRRGYDVYAMEHTRFNPTAFSKFCYRFIKCPDPAKTPEQYYQFIKKEIENHSGEVLYPMDDITMGIAVEHQEKLATLCQFAVPSKQSFLIALNKELATKLASDQGALCPVTLNSENTGSDVPSVSHMTYPLIIKPVDSSGSRGIRIAYNKEEFAHLYQEVHNQYPNPLVQEFITISRKIDVCLLYNREGKKRVCFVQEELRNYPATTGPSTVQESIVCEQAVEIATKIMDSLHWVGIAELEFVVDQNSGNLYFMEINPRFWASLELAILSGVDFPFLYYQVAMTGDCEEVLNYQIGVKTRWFFPGECLAFFSSKKKFHIDPPFFCTKKAGIIDDTLQLRDPFPLIGLLLAGVYYLINKDRRAMIFR